MKIILTTTSPSIDSEIDPRFGRGAYLLVVDTETLEWQAHPNPGVSASGGAGTMAAQFVANQKAGAVISGDFGPNAYGALQAAGVATYLSGATPHCRARPSSASRQDNSNTSARQHRADITADRMSIAVASGKGGTGKTTVATSLALSLAGGRGSTPPLFLDCDVEAPNAHLFLHPDFEEQREVGLLVPTVDEAKCTHCGKCAEVCQYHAIAVLGQKTLVFPQLCHGCGSCTALCPEKAISETPARMGVIERGRRAGRDPLRPRRAGCGRADGRAGHSPAQGLGRSLRPASMSSWTARPAPPARSWPPSAGRITCCWSPSQPPSACTT